MQVCKSSVLIRVINPDHPAHQVAKTCVPIQTKIWMTNPQRLLCLTPVLLKEVVNMLLHSPLDA